VTLIVVILVLTARGPSASPLPPGQPEIVDGQHVLDNHDLLTPVSREVYLRAREAQQLTFTSMAVVFYMVAALAVGVTGERLMAHLSRRS
jgi:hypothetical protein